MKDFITVTLFVIFNILLLVGVLLITTPSYSHHIADEEVYEKIEAMVAESQHARLAFQTTPSLDTTVMTITTDSPGFLQGMVENGIMDYFSMLDGEITVTSNYVSDTAVMTITQVEQD